MRLQDRLAQRTLGLSCQNMDAPRLGIEVARRRTRGFEDLHQLMSWHRVGPECPDSNARTRHMVEDGHRIRSVQLHGGAPSRGNDGAKKAFHTNRCDVRIGSNAVKLKASKFFPLCPQKRKWERT